jgi:formylglycine-generating enzyme required for sulfatase activity
MNPPPGQDRSELSDATDRERLGRLVASHKDRQLTSAIPAPSKSKPMSLILTLGFLVLSSGVLLFYLLMWQRSDPVKSSDNSTQPSSSPHRSVVVKHEMVAIPGGTFKMGRDDGPLQERPSHSVTVGDFLLDNTEVTTDEYATFVIETNHPVPDHWAGGMPHPEQGQWPVTNVSFHDAEAFASWRSKRDGVLYRLPTEEEWEYAARNGAQITLYPWGNEWMDDRATVKRLMPLPVGSFPKGANRWGVVDLIGNVWEWTSSKASIYEGRREVPIAYRDWMVLRGGSYASDPSNPETPISATYRDWFGPATKHPTVGFRLARSVQ